MNRQAVATFKILREHTIDYDVSSCHDQIYVMLVKDEQQYFIVADTRTLRIGQREVYSFSTGCTIMEQVVYRITKHPDIHSAYKTLDLAFYLNELNEFIFIIQVCNRRITMQLIKVLKNALRFETRPLYPEFELYQEGADRSIQVYFEGYGYPLGKFKVVPDNDSDYTFEVDDYFLNRI
jgi:hypothetical protein